VLTAGPYAEPSQVLRVVARSREPESTLALGSQPRSIAGEIPPWCPAPHEALARQSEGHTVPPREATGSTAWLGFASAHALPGSGDPD